MLTDVSDEQGVGLRREHVDKRKRLKRKVAVDVEEIDASPALKFALIRADLLSGHSVSGQAHPRRAGRPFLRFWLCEAGRARSDAFAFMQLSTMGSRN